MSEDLDDLLRHAMKTLDDQVPAGYFDELPARTLARLADGSVPDDAADAIRASSSADAMPTAEAEAPAAPPPARVAPIEAAAPSPATPAKPRDEDSGLHDIRNLASSQRMRMSAKRSSQGPVKTDDPLMASASGSWRSAVALPEPGKMVSRSGSSGELPAADEAKEAGEARPAAAAPRARKPALATAAAEPAAVTPISAAKAKQQARPAPEPKPQPAAAAGKRSGARNAIIAAAGLGLAAAAGGVIFVSTQSKSDRAAPAAAQESADRQRMEMPELRRVQPPAAVVAAPEPAMGAGSAAASAAPSVEPAPPADRAKTPSVEKPSKSVGKYVPDVVEDPKAPDKRKDEPRKKPEPGDPDFDKLLKEAGYQDKKPEAPKLERKSLSGDDIKKAMNSVAAQVSRCYDGTQGTAALKLTVAPTGQIQKVVVTGVFAGTPAGACVEGAVQGVTFPPWDGAPQSVSYSYLLAE